jgi:hypothetical protein
MDELTLLRELDADTPPPSPRAMHSARQQLRFELAYERDRRPSQAPRLFVTAVAVAAAVAVGITVLGDREATAPEPKVQLTAAGEWLTGAARDAAAEAGVPGALPRDDQYLYIRGIVKERPLDGEGARMRFVDEAWLPVDGTGLTRSSERGRSWDSPAGWMPVSYAFLKRLPTEPGELLLYARSWPLDGRDGPPMSENDYVMSYVALMGLLRADPPMPSGLRAAIYDALARIPGVEMTEGEVDARGRLGVGFKGPGPRFPVDILDPDTHEYLGHRDTLVRDEDGERVDQRIAVVQRAVVDRLGQRP